jgi:hypothetical protein
MRYIIKNNRLVADNPGVTNLSELTDRKLREIAHRYQVGDTIRTVEEQTVMQRGRAVVQQREIQKPKSRKLMEDEIRKKLTIIYEIPTDLWTTEQREFFIQHNIQDIKEIEEEQRLKEEAGIRLVIPPYESKAGRLQEAKMLREVSDIVFRDMKDRFNFFVHRDLNEKGRHIGEESRKSRPYIIEVESVPETNDELQDEKTEGTD